MKKLIEDRNSDNKLEFENWNEDEIQKTNFLNRKVYIKT